MSAHTPGPWGIWPDIKTNGELTLITDDKYARHLARAIPGAPQYKANARLIAAAPEMFELLKKWHDNFKCATDEDTFNLCEFENSAFDLIQKIEGESPHENSSD